jgi:hypothetical protein
MEKDKVIKAGIQVQLVGGKRQLSSRAARPIFKTACNSKSPRCESQLRFSMFKSKISGIKFQDST